MPSIEYLQEKGFPAWKFESRTKEPDIKAAEDALMLSFMPVFLKDIKKKEADLIEDYKEDSSLHGKYTQEQFVNNKVITEIESQMNVYRSLARIKYGEGNKFNITLPQATALQDRKQSVVDEMNKVRQEKGTNNSEYTALGKKLQGIQVNFFKTVARAEYLKIPKSKKRGALQDWDEKGPDRKFDPNNIEDVILLKSYIEGINETSAVIPKEIKSGLMARQ